MGSDLRRTLEISSLLGAVGSLAPADFAALLPRVAPRVPVPQDIQDEKINAAKAKRERRAARIATTLKDKR